MWIAYALGSALLGGLTATLIKVGAKGTHSTVAAALRAIPVCLAAWMMVFLVGSQAGVYLLGQRTLIILLLSGVTTGIAWLFYCRALQQTAVNRVVPVERAHIVLVTLFAFLLLDETPSLFKIVCLALILLGAILMVAAHGSGGIGHAVLAAVFTAATVLLVRWGASGVESYLSVALRATVALILVWLLLLLTNKTRQLANVSLRSVVFLVLSGLATGAAWLCYYRAMGLGPARYVIPIDRMSIVAAVLFSRLFLREKVPGRSLAGLLLLAAGLLLLLL